MRSRAECECSECVDLVGSISFAAGALAAEKNASNTATAIPAGYVEWPSTMPHFIVVRERGGAWDWSAPMRRQVEWDAHAKFMDALAEERFIVAGGPLGGEDDAVRVLHVVDAPHASAIETRLSEDPWTRMGLLTTVSIEPWTILLGDLAARG